MFKLIAAAVGIAYAGGLRAARAGRAAGRLARRPDPLSVLSFDDGPARSTAKVLDAHGWRTPVQPGVKAIFSCRPAWLD